MATNCVDNLDVYILTVDNLGVYQRTLLDQANWSNLEKKQILSNYDGREEHDHVWIWPQENFSGAFLFLFIFVFAKLIAFL
jgi:hypothetical protein